MAATMTTIALLTGPAAATAGPTQDTEQQRNRRVICHVFGQHCGEALRVSWCESRWHTWARNGEYLGAFQMGEWARSNFGHGPDIWTQARAALRLFRAVGHRWTGQWPRCGWEA